MSQHHTDIDTDAEPTHAGDGRGLERFSRNRYFNGKLMTARDMQAEQTYHARRLETLAGHVLGEGVVCGLETTVTADDGGVTVSIEPGVAVDSEGRLVVVDGTDKVPFTAEEVPAEGGFSLFVELDPCHAEKVPIPGSQDACSENCEYNRVVEDYDLRLVAGPPAERKPIPEVEFPTKEDLATEDSGEPHHALSTPARSYYGGDENGAFRYAGCATGGDPAVFLGYYAEVEDGWERQEITEPRHHVYGNDMLYAAVVSHATDFGNPHDVVTSVDGVEHVAGDVALESADGSILSEPGEDEGVVDLQLSGAIQEEIDALAEYVRDRVLKYTIEAFYDVAATYADVDGEIAGEINDLSAEIVTTAADALDEWAFADEADFASAVLELARLEQRILRMLDRSRTEDEFAPMATDRSFEDYAKAVEALVSRLPTDADGRVAESLPDGYADETDVTALAVDQDQLCEAGTWLEISSERTMTLPGGHEVDARIIGDVVQPRVESTEPTGLQPGDRVVDREAAEPQAAVVIKLADETAEEWTVYGDETVDFQNRDYDYASGEQVVLVSYETILDENWEYWEAADPDDLFYEVLTRSIKFHAFPEGRLQRA